MTLTNITPLWTLCTNATEFQRTYQIAETTSHEVCKQQKDIRLIAHVTRMKIKT